MIIKQDVKKVIEDLKQGKVIAIKTDTVYGLICDANNIDSCDKIYRIKKREKRKPLAIFIKNIDELKKYVVESELSKELVNLIKKYWPGPLTIILKKKKDVLEHITEGTDNIGIRIPNDRFLLEILNNIDFPLAQTSCNISGESEYKNVTEIENKLGSKVDLIVDGGEINDSKASTIIMVIDNKIEVIREGTIKINV